MSQNASNAVNAAQSSKTGSIGIVNTLFDMLLAHHTKKGPVVLYTNIGSMRLRVVVSSAENGRGWAITSLAVRSIKKASEHTQNL